MHGESARIGSFAKRLELCLHPRQGLGEQYRRFLRNHAAVFVQFRTQRPNGTARARQRLAAVTASARDQAIASRSAIDRAYALLLSEPQILIAWPATADERCRQALGGPAFTLGTVTLGHYLPLGAILFALSVIGIFLNRKNLIVLLMAIELMLLAVNMNFIAFAHHLQDLSGQVFVFFILTVAAAESAIGLAILVALFRNLRSIDVEDLGTLKG